MISIRIWRKGKDVMTVEHKKLTTIIGDAMRNGVQYAMASSSVAIAKFLSENPMQYNKQIKFIILSKADSAYAVDSALSSK